MNKRRIERVAVMILSSALLLSSTGILSSFAANVNETTSSNVIPVSSTTVSKEGGKLSSSSEITTEGGNLTVISEGEGTKANPYEISTADEFIHMQDKINLTTNGNKYFRLVNDIDLSDIREEDFLKNGGALVTVNKALANATDNVFFVLDGNGHTVKGLNVTVNECKSVSMFGYINAKSEIRNLTVDSAKITVKSDSADAVSILSTQNDGTIENVTVNSPKLTLNNVTNAGVISAVNNGLIENVTVKSDIENTDTVTATHSTVCGTGVIGAVAGTNNGKITNAAALNVGMFIPTDSKVATVYGGIAGNSSGSISGVVSTGAVASEKVANVAGGIVGKAVKGATVNSSYTLVKFDKTMNACAVIGIGGSGDMLNDCYWSSTISGCSSMTADFGAGVNDISGILFKVVGEGQTITFDPNMTWGKAVLKLDGNYRLTGTGISATVKDNKLVVKGVKDHTLNGVDYSVKISLPSTVGNEAESLAVSQKIHLPIIVGAGNGTATSPFVIESEKDFAVLAEMNGVYAKLANDITVNKAGFTFTGSLDGAGHKIITDSKIFDKTIGSVKNVKIVLNKGQSSAVFGKAINVNIDNVVISSPKDSFTVKNNNEGILFTTVSGKSTINAVSIVSDVNIAENVKNFGAIAGVVNGKDTVIKNCGVHVDISINKDKKAENVANFIGLVSAENVTVENSCVSGANNAGVYSFIAEITAKDINVSDIYLAKATKTPLDFAKYSFVDKTEFTEWTYGENNIAFFTGNGGEFSINIPDISVMKKASASDYTVDFDKSKIAVNFSTDGEKLHIAVTRQKGVVTVKASPIVITNKLNGLSVTIYVSNGLDKDSQGNYIVSNEFDIAYIGENIKELKNSSFIVTDDINMSSISEFTSIGSTVESFSGKFNGNGHKIANLKLSSSAKSGLFGAVENAEIKNLKLDGFVINSNGAYSAALVGHAVNSVIEKITITNSKVVSTEIYSGILAGSVNGGSVKNIEIFSSSVESNSNYVGALAGCVNDKGTVTAVSVENISVKGAEYVAGVAGLLDNGSKLVDITVNRATVSGRTDISGVAAGFSAESEIENTKIENSKITAIGNEAAYTGAGISSQFAGSIRNAEVLNTSIYGGTVGGIVGKTAKNCKLIVDDAKVTAVTLSANGANTVAAGVIGVHSAEGSAIVKNCQLDSGTVISSASITAGIVGSVIGAHSELTLTSAKTFATVEGCIDADAICASGIIGVIGVGALNNVCVDSVSVLGKVSGVGALGGAVAIVNDVEKFNSDKTLIKNSVIACEIVSKDSETMKNSGVIIGKIVSDKSINSKNVDSAISNVVITTYYPDSYAFGISNEIECSGYYDMDMPGGKAITPSVSVLKTADEAEILISNLPELDGYHFDSATGWVSESADRIEVVRGSEASVVLKSQHSADLGIVGYFISDGDESIVIPVHFEMKSDVRTPLKGEGTKTNPYLVSNAYDLETVSSYESEGKFFALCNDISFTDADFEFGGAFYNVGNGLVTIGNAMQGFKGTFTGLYNGVVHSINNLRLAGNEFGGLFGATDGAVISDIIINDAEISGLNYAGVLVGSANNTVITNIKINNAKVETSELGGVSGGLAGVAENTKISNVEINGLSVKTVEISTTATVEIAGGIAGVFSGTIEHAKINSTEVMSSYLAGGIVGAVKSKDCDTVITDVTENTSVKALNASGVVGRIANPLNVQINGILATGSIVGEKLSAGIIGEIDSGFSLKDASKSLIKNTVVTADINNAEISGVAVAKTDTDTFVNIENEKCKGFDNVYYSSFNNKADVFGNKEINSFQIEDYKVNDLNNLKYVVDGSSFEYIPYADTVKLGGNELSIQNVVGNFKEFTAGGYKFTLENVDGEVKYENDKLILNSKSAGSIVKFNYNNGLTLSIRISEKTEESTGNKIDIKYNLIDATSAKTLSDKTVGILLRSVLSDCSSSFSFYTKVNDSVKKIDSVYVNEDGFYVDMDIPSDCDFEVSAVGEDGKELKVKDKGNEGKLVKTDGNSSVVITVTVKDADESVWGLRSVSSNID